MKRLSLVLLSLVLFAAPPACAAFYQWTDAEGVVHFTDKRSKIPGKYLKKARQVKLPEDSARQGGAAPGRVFEPRPEPLRPGGHPETWWRRRFAALRGELAALEGGLSQKQARLLELRRERAIFTRARDRVALNEMESEIAGDEARISELRSRLDALELEATRAAVPIEWRR